MMVIRDILGHPIGLDMGDGVAIPLPYDLPEFLPLIFFLLLMAVRTVRCKIFLHLAPDAYSVIKTPCVYTFMQ